MNTSSKRNTQLVLLVFAGIAIALGACNRDRNQKKNAIATKGYELHLYLANPDAVKNQDRSFKSNFINFLLPMSRPGKKMDTLYYPADLNSNFNTSIEQVSNASISQRLSHKSEKPVKDTSFMVMVKNALSSGKLDNQFTLVQDRQSILEAIKGFKTSSDGNSLHVFAITQSSSGMDSALGVVYTPELSEVREQIMELVSKGAAGQSFHVFLGVPDSVFVNTAPEDKIKDSLAGSVRGNEKKPLKIMPKPVDNTVVKQPVFDDDAMVEDQKKGNIKRSELHGDTIKKNRKN